MPSKTRPQRRRFMIADGLQIQSAQPTVVTDGSDVKSGRDYQFLPALVPQVIDPNEQAIAAKPSAMGLSKLIDQVVSDSPPDQPTPSKPPPVAGRLEYRRVDHLRMGSRESGNGLFEDLKTGEEEIVIGGNTAIRDSTYPTGHARTPSRHP